MNMLMSTHSCVHGLCQAATSAVSMPGFLCFSVSIDYIVMPVNHHGISSFMARFYVETQP